MRTKPFRALSPRPDHVAEIASVPYDVVSTEEARALASGNPNNFLHVIRAEIDFPPGTDPYSDRVYRKALENFTRLQSDGLLQREEKECLYLYRQKMGEHSQTGIALACHIDDYAENIIRKHENTRPVKENDRTKLVDTLNANPGPVFLTYRNDATIDALVERITKEEAPAFDFVDPANVQHTVWRVEGGADFVAAFDRVPLAYVADGHHRSASAYRVGIERRVANPNHDGSENYNWFLAVLFPAGQLRILPYNRVVKDLNGLSTGEFLARLREHFTVSDAAPKAAPAAPGSVCMYLDGHWRELSWPGGDSPNPIAALDVSVLQDRLLNPVLGIGDPRTDNRIDFVGGIRGTAELEKRVDEDGWAVAFSLFPVTVDKLIAIADADDIMPPKSTWFEPKLRSGLFVYTLD